MSSNLPEKFTYPFCYTPHPLIVKAAESLCRRIASDPTLAPLFAPGKMLGVLMVAKKCSEIVTSGLYSNEGSFNRGNLQPVACEAQATGRAGEPGGENSFVGLKPSQSNDSECVTPGQRQPSFDDSEIVTSGLYSNADSFNRGNLQPVACEAQATGRADKPGGDNSFVGLKTSQSNDSECVTPEQRQPSFNDSEIVTPEQYSNEGSSNRGDLQPVACEAQATDWAGEPGGENSFVGLKPSQSNDSECVTSGQYSNEGSFNRGDLQPVACEAQATGRADKPGGGVDFLFGFSGLVGGRSLIDGFVPPIFDTASIDINSSSHEESIRLQNWLFEQYVVSNGLGERLSVLDIFARRGLVPPGGTGDCAAPKLLQYAYSHHLKPLAMGEFWYGASPRGEVRRHGCFYPSCTGKCGPLLGFMLQGLDVEPNPLDNDNLWSLSDPVVKYEDSDIIVVDKPSGMLSVPGRTSRRSLQDWLSDYCGCTIYACHRLDMDTSGLMVFAKTPEAQENIQRQFENREVRKQYLAHLCPAAIADGLSQPQALKPGDTGKISLPLMLDYYDRPRQKVDFADGKPAVTGYEILRELPGGYLEVRFTPFTGRTHQLRVHAAHALGLGRPILGDRLYGGHSGCLDESLDESLDGSQARGLKVDHTCDNGSNCDYSIDLNIGLNDAHDSGSDSGHDSGSERLMLHASLLSFRHPTTGSRLHFTSDTLPERN